MKRFSSLVLFALVLSGCGGGGTKNPVGTVGRYSFDLYWAINTRSFEQDALSLRVTATRLDGTGTPVIAIFNRPTNIDVVNTVSIPREFQPGRHRLAFELFNGLEATGTRIGIGLLERRMSPDSDNRVRVNIGAPDAQPGWRVSGISSLRGYPGDETRVLFSTGTSSSGDQRDVESAVNLVPEVNFQIRVGESRLLEKTGEFTFRFPETGFYQAQILANGFWQSEAVLRSTGPNPGYGNPLVASPWPTGWGPASLGRNVAAPGPRAIGASARVSLQDFPLLEDGKIAIAEDGDVIVLYESTAGSEAAVARFSPDLTVRRWRTALPQVEGMMLQVAVLRNGLILVERTGRFDALNAQTGSLDWSRSGNRLINWPAPIIDNFVAGVGEFLSLGSGNRAFQTNNRVTGVAPDGTAVNASGEMFDIRNPSAVVSSPVSWSSLDPSTGWIYSLFSAQYSAYNFRTGATLQRFGVSVLAHLPAQGELVIWESGSLRVASASTLETIRSLNRNYQSVVPITFTNRVLLISQNDRLRAIDLDSAAELWNFGITAIALGGTTRRAYALFGDGTIGMVAE